jgi:hypothetical protein
MSLLQELATNPTAKPEYSLQAGILRYKNRIMVGATTDLKEKLFKSFHDSIFGGHSGKRVTLHRLKQLFYWPSLKQYVAEKLAQCPVCHISKTEHVQYPGLLNPLNIPKIK